MIQEIGKDWCYTILFLTNRKSHKKIKSNNFPFLTFHVCDTGAFIMGLTNKRMCHPVQLINAFIGLWSFLV